MRLILLGLASVMVVVVAVLHSSKTKRTSGWALVVFTPLLLSVPFLRDYREAASATALTARWVDDLTGNAVSLGASLGLALLFLAGLSWRANKESLEKKASQRKLPVPPPRPVRTATPVPPKPARAVRDRPGMVAAPPPPKPQARLPQPEAEAEPPRPEDGDPHKQWSMSPKLPEPELPAPGLPVPAPPAATPPAIRQPAPHPKAPSANAPLGWLEAVRGPLAGHRFPIAGPTRIGRQPGSDITIRDPGVSPVHARIIPEGSDLCLYDARSTLGTVVNHVSVLRHVLVDGDSVLIGANQFIFRRWVQ